MALPGVAEMAFTVILIGAIWLAGVVFIKAADRVEMHKAAALRSQRTAPKGRRRN